MSPDSMVIIRCQMFLSRTWSVCIATTSRLTKPSIRLLFTMLELRTLVALRRSPICITQVSRCTTFAIQLISPRQPHTVTTRIECIHQATSGIPPRPVCLALRLQRLRCIIKVFRLGHDNTRNPCSTFRNITCKTKMPFRETKGLSPGTIRPKLS